MHTAFWVGLRIYLLPVLIFGAILLFRAEGGALSAQAAALHPAAGMFTQMTSGAGNILSLASGTTSCNTLGFGCGGNRTTGAKFLRP